MAKRNLLLLFIFGIALSFDAAAKLYKWVDNNGVTHYGETIPPEYANKDRQELNKEGRVVKSEEALTPEKRKAKEQEEAKKRDEARTEQEKRRYDSTLINTYSNAKEIELARSRSLQQIDARIEGINATIKTAKDSLLSLQKEADGYTQANKKIPDSLHDDIKRMQDRLGKLQLDLEKSGEEKSALDARFDADRARYIELTGKKP